MVGVAQLVERWIVVPVAEGSNPSTHPTPPFKKNRTSPFWPALALVLLLISPCVAQTSPADALLQRQFRDALAARDGSARQYLKDAADRPWVGDLNFVDACVLAVETGRDLPAESEKLVSVTALRNPALAKKNADGYFEMRAILNENFNQQTAPRRDILVVDNSL